MSNGVLDIYEKLWLGNQIVLWNRVLKDKLESIEWMEWKKLNDPSYLGYVCDSSSPETLYDLSMSESKSSIESTKASISQLEKRLQELTGESNG